MSGCNILTHGVCVCVRVFRTKNERAEQFSKRMHKEGCLTKAEKDAIRAKNMINRDRWEDNNLGGFNRVYPNESYVCTL